MHQEYYHIVGKNCYRAWDLCRDHVLDGGACKSCKLYGAWLHPSVAHQRDKYGSDSDGFHFVTITRCMKAIQAAGICRHQVVVAFSQGADGCFQDCTLPSLDLPV
jgi:hypothetical protein